MLDFLVGVWSSSAWGSSRNTSIFFFRCHQRNNLFEIGLETLSRFLLFDFERIWDDLRLPNLNWPEGPGCGLLHLLRLVDFGSFLLTSKCVFWSQSHVVTIWLGRRVLSFSCDPNTSIGILVISSLDWKHFQLLLLGFWV